MLSYRVDGSKLFWTEKDATGHGAIEVSIDLSPIFIGSIGRNVTYPFSGRSGLAAYILHAFGAICAERKLALKSAHKMYTDFVFFLRFLDEMEAVAKATRSTFKAPKGPNGLMGSVWSLFIKWLSASGHSSANSIYYHVKRLFDRAAKEFLTPEEAGAWLLDPNPFPNLQKQRSRPTNRNKSADPDEKTLRAVARLLEDQIKTTERRFSVARGILNEMTTMDQTAPKGGSDDDAHPAAEASSRTAREEMLPAFQGYPLGPAVRDAYAWGKRLSWRPRKRIEGDHPFYQVQGIWEPIPASRLAGCLHAFVPNREDVEHVFALHCMHTGWNFGTTTDMLFDDWVTDHPTRPDLVARLHSRKARAQSKGQKGKIQIAYSLKHKSFRPYNLIQMVLLWTSPLRESIRAELDTLVNTQKNCGSIDESRLQVLRRMSRRVWLYLDKTGDIAYFDIANAGGWHSISSLIRAAELKLPDGTIPRFSQEFVRKSWAVFAYEGSGFNLIVTQMALGHSDLASLLSYLDRKAIRNRNRKEWFNLQRNVLAFLERGALDVRSLRKIVQGGQLSDDEARTLASRSTLTRQGVLCSSPRKPDGHVEPSHRLGELCRKQNCLDGCSRAFVTWETSLYLARRILELRALRDSMSLPVWISSDYPHDLDFAEWLLGQFTEENQRAAFADAKSKQRVIIPSVPSKVSLAAAERAWR